MLEMTKNLEDSKIKCHNDDGLIGDKQQQPQVETLHRDSTIASPKYTHSHNMFTTFLQNVTIIKENDDPYC